MRKYLQLTTAQSTLTEIMDHDRLVRSIDKIELRRSSFPSGMEEHVRVEGEVKGHDVTIVSVLQSDKDIMALLLATDAVRRAGANSVALVMPYLPYARQDRVCTPGEALSAKVMADLINSQNYTEVISYDCHSMVMPALIDNYKQPTFFDHVAGALKDYPEAVLCAPDAGAVKRTQEAAISVGKDHNKVVMATKDRLSTGRVVTSSIVGDVLGKAVIVVDDICDGGGTFLALADKLWEMGATAVILCVTHGLFTKGIDILLEGGITDIYTTNSINREHLQDQRLKVFQLNTHQ